VYITHVLHASPAHVSGVISVGDELVSIDDFAVTDDLNMFAQRAAAGSKESWIKLCTRHPDSPYDPERIHTVLVQRADCFEIKQIFFAERTNDSIGSTAAVEAGIGVVVAVSTLRTVTAGKLC
jgi:hypothetical protein